MQARYPEIRELGGQVLVVSFSRPDQVAAYQRKHPLPFPVVADPERAGYRAFGLGRTSWWNVFRPRVLAGYLRLMLRGGKVERPNEGEDLLQLGGDFVLDGSRRVAFAYRSADPTDRPTPEGLVQAVSRAGAE